MARRLICLGIFIGWLILCQVSVAAQTGATLSGTVADQNGDLVEGAEVRVLNIASGRANWTKTDASGTYKVASLPAGSYQISISHEGFAMAARRITLSNSA